MSVQQFQYLIDGANALDLTNYPVQDGVMYVGPEVFNQARPENLTEEQLASALQYMTDYMGMSCIAANPAMAQALEENESLDSVTATFALPNGHTIDHTLYREYQVGETVNQNYVVSGLTFDLGNEQGAMAFCHNYLAEAAAE